MKIGIMQPYFFPHLPYFQLIDSVDVYVNLDHVSFMKRSYMVRNRIKNDLKVNVNVLNASQNQKCNSIKIDMSERYISKFLKKLNFLYGKEKKYNFIMEEILIPNLKNNEDKTISEFNLNIIKSICNYLDIKTKIIDTSEGITDNPKEIGLIDIVKNFKGTSYVNAIGGLDLYSKDFFKSKNINLFFLKTEIESIPDKHISILDLLFTYEKDFIVNELKKYELI